MTIEQQILARLKGYTEAFYKQDFEALASYFYKEEVQLFRENIEWIAKAMLPFGKMEGFMQLFNHISPQELSELPDKEFMRLFFSNAAQQISMDKLRDMISSVEIEEIDHADYIANVRYSYTNVFFDEDLRTESEVNLILSENEWYLLFRTQMTDDFSRMRKRIENYNETAKMDNPDFSSTPDDEIERYGLFGFRTIEDDVIIYPRFTDAGEFNNGLAPVKAFSLWGFINKKGEYVVEPQYIRAECFMEGMAAVAIRSDDFEILYGYINIKGKEVIGFLYDEAKMFSEGKAAVRQGDFWGYINRKGEVMIPFVFELANDFEDGKAIVEKDGNLIYIDHDGNQVEGTPLDDNWSDEDLWDDDDDDDDNDDFY